MHINIFAAWLIGHIGLRTSDDWCSEKENIIKNGITDNV